MAITSGLQLEVARPTDRTALRSLTAPILMRGTGYRHFFSAFDKVNMGSLGFIAVHRLIDCGYANLGLAAPKAPSCSLY